MTLTKEQREAYGPDWPAVSREVRDRSGGRCECEGECGWKRHQAGRCPAQNGKLSPFTGSRVVLTAAHLDRNGHEGVHDLARIKAMCNGCHLAYDRQARVMLPPGRLEDVLSPEEVAAMDLIRDRFGVDVRRTYQFWERLTALLTAGEVTAAQYPYDVVCGEPPHEIRVEVKFSQEWEMRPKRVFKWAEIRPDQADVTVLYGIDALDDVYVWVAPSSELQRSVTVTSPRTRVQPTTRGVGRWQVPFDQVLTAISRAYDRKVRA